MAAFFYRSVVSSRHLLPLLSPLLILMIFFVAITDFYINKSTCDSDFESGCVKDDDPTLMSLLRHSYLSPPSPLPYNLSTDPSYKERAVGYTWRAEYEIVKGLFDDEYGKFFVEAGGLDGEFLSNTLWLEQNRSWTGLLVEPERRNYRDMVNKRRKCWISNSCLSTTKYARVIHMEGLDKHPNNTFLDAEALRGGTREITSIQNVDYIKQTVVMKPFTSQCFPLYSYMLALNRTVIDFLSLDIQGTELDVINTIPTDKIFIRLLVLEFEVKVYSDRLVSFMNKKGFKILTVFGSPDYYFVNAKSEDLIQRYKDKFYKNRGDYLQEIIDEGIGIVLTFTGPPK